MESPKGEKLVIYGFSFEYPAGAKIEFNPKFNRDEGDVAVKFTGEHNTFVSWGPLEKAKKFGSLEEHAKHSIENVRKRVQGKVKSIQRREVQVNGHSAEYNHVKVDVPKRGLFGRGEVQEIHSLHLHCTESTRYFVIYGSSRPEKSESQGEIVTKLVESFRCH